MDLLHTDLTEKESYIGKKFIGFKFPKSPEPRDLFYDNYMDKFIGLELEIMEYNREHDCFRIIEKKPDCNQSWWYPAKLVIEQLIENSKTEDEMIQDVFSILNKLK